MRRGRGRGQSARSPISFTRRNLVAHLVGTADEAGVSRQLVRRLIDRYGLRAVDAEAHARSRYAARRRAAR